MFRNTRRRNESDGHSILISVEERSASTSQNARRRFIYIPTRRIAIAQTQTRPIIAAFRSYSDASSAVTKLANVGVPIERISLMMSQQARDLIPKVRSVAPEGALGGGSVGALAGGLIAVASLAVPGGILAAGPLAAALGGGAAGAATGGLVGALVGAGIEEPQAKQYAQEILEDGYVIVVHPLTDDMAESARNLFKASRGVRLQRPGDSVAARIARPIQKAVSDAI